MSIAQAGWTAGKDKQWKVGCLSPRVSFTQIIEGYLIFHVLHVHSRMLGKLVFLCGVLIAQSKVAQRVANSIIASEKDHAGPGQCKAALSRYARLVVSSDDELIDVTKVLSCSWAPASATALPKLNLPPR